MDATPTLGKVIRSRRFALGLTQEQLAERIGDGVRQAEVSRLECDRVGLPRWRRLERIAAALELPLGDLLATAGWSGAERAFPTPAERTAPTMTLPVVVAAKDDDRSSRQRSRSPLTDLREALARAQETRLQTVQVLNNSRELAARWNAGWVKRMARQPRERQIEG
jgi:transcriptional regulator with XRE-family HTH domain